MTDEIRDRYGFQAVARGLTVVNIPGLMVRNSQGQPIATGNPQVSIRVQ